MTTTVAALLAHAAAQIGTLERTGNNDVLYADYWGITGYAWCYAFVEWCFDTVGGDSRLPYVTMYVPSGVIWSRENLQAVERDQPPIPGDIVHFTWSMSEWPPDRPGTGDHVGLVESVDGDRIVCIEGNVGSPQGVWRVARSINATVVNYWRPQVYTDTQEADMTPHEHQMLSDTSDRVYDMLGKVNVVVDRAQELINHIGGVHVHIDQNRDAVVHGVNGGVDRVNARVADVGGKLETIVTQVNTVAEAARVDRAATAAQVKAISDVAATVDDIAQEGRKEREQIAKAIAALPAGGGDAVAVIRAATGAQLAIVGVKRLIEALNIASQAGANQQGEDGETGPND